MSLFLDNLKIELFGESHGEYIGARVYGLPGGYEIDICKIENVLKKRNPNTFYNTLRKDANEILFVEGFEDSKIIGDFLEFRLLNTDILSKDYKKYQFRLGHADYVSFKKFGDSYPYAGGGPFSGRLTAPIVAIGEICRQILESKNYSFDIFGQVKRLLDFESKTILDRDILELKKVQDIKCDDKSFLCFDINDEEEILLILKEIKSDSDSVGCNMEFRICGISDNFGDTYFGSFESKLSSACFSIPGIKGINFGSGDEFYKKRGSELQEKVEISENKIKATTNINGGINGGILNGYQDIYFNLIIKPPMSLNKEMDTLIFRDGKYVVEKNSILGRHDTFIGNKVKVVVEAYIYIIILDYVLDM